jgi:hypothetical protein
VNLMPAALHAGMSHEHEEDPFIQYCISAKISLSVRIHNTYLE